jgi:hypothetical protein
MPNTYQQTESVGRNHVAIADQAASQGIAYSAVPVLPKENQEEEELQIESAGQLKSTAEAPFIQKKENKSSVLPKKTGMFDNLKSDIGNPSGIVSDNVKGHYNSSQPAQLNTPTYTQKTSAHERYLPHEAWHVIQQKQTGVRPTLQAKEVAINDDKRLDKKVDVMRGKASQFGDNPIKTVAQTKLQEMAINSSQAKQVDQLLPGIIQRMLDTNFAQITTQVDLNAALQRLNPQVRGMTQVQYEARGATPQMLDAAIADSNLNLYNSMSRGELLRNLRPLLDNHVTNDPATYAYDPHGDKHFPGGPAGTKFNGTKGAVNPQLIALIEAEIGRIRRDASGNNQTYYYTLAGIPECGNLALTIQVDYTYLGDTITFHGYPDAGVLVYSLSRVKNGGPIP